MLVDLLSRLSFRDGTLDLLAGEVGGGEVGSGGGGEEVRSGEEWRSVQILFLSQSLAKYIFLFSYSVCL